MLPRIRSGGARVVRVAGFVFISLLLVLGQLIGPGMLPVPVAAAAVSLAVQTQPAGAVAATVFTTQPRFEARNPNGTLDAAFAGNVTVAIKAGTGTVGATLAGTTTVAAVAGVAIFTNLIINRAGTGYKLVATSTTLAPVETNAFDVAIGPAANVTFAANPGNAVAGAAFGNQPTGQIVDAGGNIVTSSTAAVTLAITPGTGTSGAVLSGTTTVNATGGVAYFGGLSINLAGAGYTLNISSPGLTGPPSGVFTVSGAAAKLSYFTQPGAATAGAAFGSQPVVDILDTNNNRVWNSAAPVTLAITSGTGAAGAVLSGTVTVAAVNGRATFTGLSISKDAVGYTLTATSGALAPSTSIAFNVAQATATNLVMTTQPGGAVAGVAFITQPVVTARDAFGNTVTSFTSNVTVFIGTNPSGGTLSGTLTVAAVAGVATFTNLSIDNAGNGYTLTAGSGALSQAASSAFNVTAGATQLVFTTQPSANNTAATNFGTQPVVEIRDVAGNRVMNSTVNVTVAITAGTGAPGATLGGTVTVAAVAGRATFTNLQINLGSAADYTLTATSGSLSFAVSNGFKVAGAAAKLTVTTNPAGASAGAAFTTQPVVQVQDANGNLVTTSTVNVTIGIGTNPSGGTLSGGLTVAAVGGVVTFAGLSIDKTGTGYTLNATSAGLASGASGTFNVVPAVAAKLAFTTQPSTVSMAGAVFAAQPVVQIQDANSNVVTSSTAPVTLTISAGTVSGTVTVNAVNGVATFSGLSVPAAAAGLTLTANSGALTAATSNAFSIAGAATQVAFTTSPSTPTNATLAFTTQPVVEVRDALGTRVIDSGASVAVAIRAGTGAVGAVLSGTTTVAAVNGVATFVGLSIDKASAGYQLTATSGALTAGNSAAFTIAVGAATKLAFTTQPSVATAGVVLLTQPVVTVQDAGGNTVVGSTASIALAVKAGTGPGTVSAGTPVSAVAGVATFLTATIDTAGQGYVITASSAGLTSVDSGAFNVSGAAAKLAFLTSPAGAVAGANFLTQPVVEVRDANDNRVTNSIVNVNVAVTPGTGTPGATVTGTIPVAAVAGRATFTDLQIATTGSGYTLTASSGGLGTGASSAFNVAGTAAKLAFITQPGGAEPGVNFTTQPVVEIQDTNGNRMTNSVLNVALAIKAGTGTAGAVLGGTTTVAAVAGRATFTNLNINLAGTGYVLTATNATLASADSSAFDVAIGAATTLVVTTSPAGAVAGSAFGTQPVVQIRDAAGLVVTSSTAPVTLTITTNPGGGTLSGVTTINAVAGIATFAGLSIDKVGVGYVLTASSPSLTSAATGAFTVTPGAANRLAFTTQPSANNTATVNFGTQPVVTIRDANGNTDVTSTANVTMAITTGTGTTGAILGGGLTVAAVAGVATFAGLNIDLPGTGYTLTATSGALTSATSATMNVAAITTRLVVANQPSSQTGGVAFGTQPSIQVQDASGNIVTSSIAPITLAIKAGTGTAGATLGGVTTVAAVAGVATFAGLNINLAGTGYILTAVDSTLGAQTLPTETAAFNITVGPATTLVFTTQPGSATAGVAFNRQPVVAARDAGGNTVASYTSNVTLAITPATGAVGAILGGTATVAAVGGVATFTNLSINLAGINYFLTASSGNLPTSGSAGFSVAGTATQLAFMATPAGATTGAAFTTQPAIWVEDANNVLVSNSSVSVAIAITGGTGTTGAVLGGTTTITAVNGVATFSGLSIDLAGAGYTLTSTSTGLTAATSGAFTVGAGAAQLVFTTNPSTPTGAGTAFATQPAVTVRDSSGNTVISYTGNVTVAITGTAGAVLGGTTTVAAVAGVATFAGLNVNLVGAGYTLTATAGGLITGASGAFNIIPGAAAKLAYTTQPSAVNTFNTAFGTQPVVTIQDANGNTDTTSTANVTIAITAGTGSAGAALTGTVTVAAIAGVATFAGLAINLPGTGYTLRATSGALTAATSSALSVAGTAAKLVVNTQPSAANTAATNFTTQPQVYVVDANDIRVTSSGANVTVAITPGTGTAGATLGGALTVAAGSGIVNYAGLNIDLAGTGYTLTFTSAGLASTTSGALSVASAAANRLAFGTQPSSANSAGVVFGRQPVILVQDAGGNTITTSTASVTLTITGGTGTAGAILGGTTTVAAVAGVATFSGLSVDLAGTAYTLNAASTGLTAATSAALSVAGPAAQLAVTTSPSSPTTAGTPFATQPVVTIRDAGGRTVANSTASVTVAITSGTGPAGAVLSGTVTVAAVNGVATFSGLSINLANAGYTLTATSGSLTSAASGAFTIVAGAAAKLAVTTQPSTSNTAGAIFGTQPVVTIQDAYGNTDTTSFSNVTFSSTVVLQGTTTVAAVAGVATFTNLGINTAGTGYVLAASSGVLGGANTNPINVAAATGARLVFTTNPAGAVAGATFATQPVVTVQDGYGNTDPTSTASVTLAIGANPGAGTLSGTLTVSAVAGVATFSGLSINNAGTGYTLTANATGLTTGTSAGFNVAGAATQLAVTTQPSAASTSAAAFAVQPVVTIRDAAGRTVTNSSAAVTLSITPGTGTAGAVLGGTTTVNAVNGMATFTGLNVNLVGTGYTLTATSTGLTSAATNAFNIVVAPAARLVFGTSPSGATVGAAFTTQPVVLVQDASGNLTGSNAAVTVVITSGTGAAGAVLAGLKTVAAVNGVAIFSGLNIDLAGTGYTLTAASAGLTSSASSAFNVVVSSPSRLAFTTSPAGAIVGSPFATQPVVVVQDASGNIINSSAAVTLAITSGTGAAGAGLYGTKTVNAVAGVATFTGLYIDWVGNGYTLTATSSGLTSGASSAFNVAAGTAVMSVNLQTGWNLISPTVIPSNTAIETVLAGILPSVVSVWQYDAVTSTWHSYTPGAPPDLLTIQDGKGYWLNVSGPGTLTFTGVPLPPPPATPPTYNVVLGWNLIGFKSTVSREASDYLSAIAGKYTMIYGYINGAFTVIQPSDSLQPGYGYWVAVTAPGTIYP